MEVGENWCDYDHADETRLQHVRWNFELSVIYGRLSRMSRVKLHCLQYLVKQLNFPVILLNIIDHVTQIYSKIIKSFTLN